jgi:protein-L-isoaspartate(D-aspartate) O-methyltransferase
MNVQDVFEDLIENHIEKGYLRDISLKDSILNVQIYDLIDNDEDLQKFFMADEPILCYYENDNDYRTVTAPHMISVFLSILELSSSDEVLILGAKGGYIAAIIANIVKYVYILEEHQGVAEITNKNLTKLGVRNVKLINKNPLLGLPDLGPFNKILVTGAIKEIPGKIFDQLARFGILVAPIIIKKKKQQVIQFIKQKNEIQEVSFGGVIFQDLYYSDLKYSPEKIQKPVREAAFTETYANLPKVQIVNLAFNGHFDELNQRLDVNSPTYRIYYHLRNNSENEVTIQVKLEMPSLDKDNISDLIPIPPHGEIKESIIAANPKSEGRHDFNVIVCDDNKYRLDKMESCVDIKRSKMRKLIDISLTILKFHP